MKKFFAILFMSVILSGCAMDATDLSIGNSYTNYAKKCRQITLMKPKLVYNDGKVQGYHCADAAGADIWRYEFFENGKLVKVHSRPVTAEERNQRFQTGMMGLAMGQAIMNSSTPSANTSTIGTVNPTRIYSFDIPSGVNTVCFYNQAGGMYSQTIPRGQICPRILN